MTADDSFRTGLVGAKGVWPQLPAMWSFTSLRDAEECPRRWMLTRAQYPDIWSRAGYPPKLSVASLLGDVVHAALELILRGFQVAGSLSGRDPSTVAVLKSLGGYSKIAERAIDERLAKLADNPRVAGRLHGLRVALFARLPDIRQRIQELVSRTRIMPAPAHEGGVRADRMRGPLSEGSHAEVELRADGLRLIGRVDLLTLFNGSSEILDYKTGTASVHHPDQLMMYALLWSLDSDLNPARLPATSLTIAYPTHDVKIEPPDIQELPALADAFERRIQQAETSLAERPPSARPSDDWCHMCQVRQLCNEYWETGLPSLGLVSEGTRFDFQGVVKARNGSRSWRLESDRTGDALLLRTATESITFRIGEQLRILDLTFGGSQESAVPVGTMTQWSEAFVYDPALA